MAEHAKPARVHTILALLPPWLVAPETGEAFESKEDRHQRL
jgi:hypothetical protein